MIYLVVFLVFIGTMLVGLGQTLTMILIGSAALLTGLTFMVLSMAHYEEETE